MPIRLAQVGAFGQDPLKIAARVELVTYRGIYEGVQQLRFPRNQANLCQSDRHG
jgi:hypothetical protein